MTIAVETWDDLYAFARQTFVNGVLTGQPFGENIATIFRKSVDFGTREGEMARPMPFTVNFDNGSEVKDHVIMTATEALFGGNVKAMLEQVCHTGAAWGYQQQRCILSPRVDFSPTEAINELVTKLTEAEQDSVLNSIDFGTYRMVGVDDPLYSSLENLGVTRNGIVRMWVYGVVKNRRMK
jgi:hypothetical protein